MYYILNFFPIHLHFNYSSYPHHTLNKIKKYFQNKHVYPSWAFIHKFYLLVFFSLKIYFKKYNTVENILTTCKWNITSITSMVEHLDHLQNHHYLLVLECFCEFFENPEEKVYFSFFFYNIRDVHCLGTAGVYLQQMSSSAIRKFG